MSYNISKATAPAMPHLGKEGNVSIITPKNASKTYQNPCF